MSWHIDNHVDGVIRFYDRYPASALKGLLKRDWSAIKKQISYSPVVSNIQYAIIPYIEQQHILTALRRFLNEELLNIN